MKRISLLGARRGILQWARGNTPVSMLVQPVRGIGLFFRSRCVPCNAGYFTSHRNCHSQTTGASIRMIGLRRSHISNGWALAHTQRGAGDRCGFASGLVRPHQLVSTIKWSSPAFLNLSCPVDTHPSSLISKNIWKTRKIQALLKWKPNKIEISWKSVEISDEGFGDSLGNPVNNRWERGSFALDCVPFRHRISGECE